MEPGQNSGLLLMYSTGVANMADLLFICVRGMQYEHDSSVTFL
jgi:hypothetical protein